MKPQNRPLNILVMRLSSIGDLILLTPIFRELRKAAPSAQIDLLTFENHQAIFAGNPHIRKIYSFNKSETPDACLKKINQQKYDLILDAHRNRRTRKCLSKIWKNNPSAKVIKVNKRYRFRLCLLWLKKHMGTPETQIESYLNLVTRAFPETKPQKHTEVFPTEKNFREAKKVLKNESSKPILALNPCASFQTKKWPEEQFLELFRKLSPEFRIAWVIEKPESVSPAFWEECRKSNENFSVLCGLEILTLAACLKQCSLAISNDSMLTHLAEAVNTPVLCIFGGTVPELGFAPFLRESRSLVAKVPCQPCHLQGRDFCKNKKNPYLCFQEISVAKVAKTVKEILSGM